MNTMPPTHKPETESLSEQRMRACGLFLINELADGPKPYEDLELLAMAAGVDLTHWPAYAEKMLRKRDGEVVLALDEDGMERLRKVQAARITISLRKGLWA